MKKNNFLIAILFVIFVTSCDLNSRKLQLINNSDKIIYYCLLTNDLLYTGLHTYYLYPLDTVYPNFVMGGEGAWEYSINKESKDSSLYIYIFNNEEITSEALNNHQYKVKGFKVSDLDSLDWIVTYPDDFK